MQSNISQNGKFIFPVADFRLKFGGDQELRHPPWYGNTQSEEKIKEIFLENQKGLHLHHLTTHFRMPVKQ